METVKGCHGEFNMGSPGGWEYQRIAQLLGQRAWNLILENVEVGKEYSVYFRRDRSAFLLNSLQTSAHMPLKTWQIVGARKG